MKKIFQIFIVSLFLLMLVQCDDNVQKRPKVSGGKTNEIIAVMEGKARWQSLVGDTIQAFFMQPDTMLSQPEKLFSLATLTEKQFRESNIFPHHHNILIINKDTSFKKPIVETKENVWTSPQRVVWIKYATDSEFFTLFEKYQNTILKMFDDLEILRTYQTMLLGSNQVAKLEIDKIFHIDLDVPAGFSIAHIDTNFMWLTQTMTKQKRDLTVGIMIWSTPYLSEKQFSMNDLIKSRNEFAQKYISGPSEGSFMKTSLEYIAPRTKVITEFPTGYAVEMRGLWDMVGDFMGGPFISYTFVHPKTQQLITLEGFVYHPNNEKRVFLRQMQSVFMNFKTGKTEETSVK